MTFVSSVYTFTEPVRKFKANDPYYYEVDNIPIGQLEENCLWLKDQLTSAIALTFDRDVFTELQPYVNGADNKVRVRPGRFSARINDASNKIKLQALANNSTILGGNKWTIDAFTTSTEFDNLVAELISSTASLGFNGLESRILIHSQNQQSTYAPNAGSHYPGPFTIPAPILATFGLDVINQSLAWASTEFIKAFRSPGRTAIVDVPSELTISVDKWDSNDFFYIPSEFSQQKILIPATTRIDLLVVLAHPIDVSSTRVFSPDSPNTITTITEPRLAIIKGAGVGIRKADTQALFASKSTGASTEGINVVVNDSITTFTTNPYSIIPSPGDQNNSNLGFKGLNIKGTFPSPDDLLNVSPILNSDGTNPSVGTGGTSVNDFQLVGQSVLPLAYIVVNNTTSTDPNGNIVLGDSNIVDIRPFFRTTELTYNERAGIMASFPPLSLANPAVNRKNLDDAVKELSNSVQLVDNKINGQIPRVVGGGMIWGGLNFGPEGAIDNILYNYGSPQNLVFSGINSNVPANPDWDDAEWFNFGFAGVDQISKGTLRNDKINFYYKAKDTLLDGGASDSTGFLGIFDESFSDVEGWLVSWVKKTISFNKSNVSWLTDYSVDVTLENCVGMTSKYGGSNADDEQAAGSYGTYVERNANNFTIYVFWVSTRPNSNQLPHTDRSSKNYTQWVARHSAFASLGGTLSTKSVYPTGTKYPLLAACTYPTVNFKITGYPTGTFTNKLTQLGTPIITLK